MFNSAKNFMAGKAAQVYVNNLIARYAVLRDLKIDPDGKTVEVLCQLHGEADAIRVHVGYRVQERGPKHFVQIVTCTCSRPWVQNLIEDFGKGREVEVPSWALSAL